MEKPSRDLMHEHQPILIALDVIEKMNKRVRDGQEVDYRYIEETIDFLILFADKFHHGKEEKYLFPALEETGIKNQGGSIGVMLEQHRKGRELIKQMQSSIGKNRINKNAFIEASSSYVNLLRMHIEKENTILFPLCDSSLSASKQQELSDNFKRHEKEILGEGVHEELLAKMNRLKKEVFFTLKTFMTNEIVLC
jgi:hemerythrin-like domain-containing protein